MSPPKKLKIGLFTDTYLPTINGISFAIDSTRKELEKLGHEVFIFAPRPSIRHKESDSHIIRFPAIKGIVFKENMTSLFFPSSQVKKIDLLQLDIIHFFTPNQVGLLGAYVAIKNHTTLVGQYCTDVYRYIQFYPNTTTALFWLPAALPLVSQYPAKYWRDIISKLRSKRANEQWRQRMLGQALRVVHDQCTQLIAPSAKMVRQLKSFGITKPIVRLPNGVDPLPSSKKQVVEFSKFLDVQPTHKVLLYVGRLGQEKNIELLIKAFNLLADDIPEAKLVICGDFEHRANLENLASKSRFKNRIVFTGMIPHEQLGSIYALAEVFVFPSTTDTQALVLHEAAGAGLPIVMVDKEITSVVREGYNGFFAKNQPKDFALQVTKLLRNNRLRNKMGKSSRKLAKQYTASRQIRELEALYKALLKQD